MTIEICGAVIVIILFVIAMALLWFNGKKKLVKEIILELVLIAEKTYGARTGPIKFASVLSEIYKEFPWLVHLEKLVTEWINQAVEYIKNN